jgi:hypothetical protein
LPDGFTMNTREVVLWEFLDGIGVVNRDRDFKAELRRVKLEESALVTSLERIASAVNDNAGYEVIEVRSFASPEQLIRSFNFRDGNLDHVMRIELWGALPVLVFLTRKWKGPSFLPRLVWLRTLLGFRAFDVDVKFSSDFDPDEVADDHVEKWFSYLFSGLAGDQAPSHPEPTERCAYFSLSPAQ